MSALRDDKLATQESLGSRRTGRSWLHAEVGATGPAVQHGTIAPVAWLKDGTQALLVALRAGEVVGLRVGFVLVERVYQHTGWLPLKMVASKLGLRLVRLLQAGAERQKLALQVNIRELRVHYLVSQLGQQSFDLRICTRLRRLERALDANGEIRCRTKGLRTAPDEVNGLIDQLETEVQRAALLRRTLARTLASDKRAA